jgi:hypothetical protein
LHVEHAQECGKDDLVAAPRVGEPAAPSTLRPMGFSILVQGLSIGYVTRTAVTHR